MFCNSVVSVQVFLFAVVVGSSTAMAQYGYWGPSTYVNLGAYPSMNAAATNRTIYNQKQAAKRQSLAQVQQRHTAQNQFLINKSRRHVDNSRTNAESFVQSHQTRQLVLHVGVNGPARATVGSLAKSHWPPQLVLRLGDYAPTAATPEIILPTMLPTEYPGNSYYVDLDWPALLKLSTFRKPRVRIETIMQKAEPGRPGLRESDFNQIVLAVNRMKSSLRRMADDLNAREYIDVTNFLDKLSQKAKAAVRR